MNQIQNAVAQRQTQQAPATIATFISSLTPEIARAVPRGMDADRLARIALTEVRKTPKLASCTPESFAGALLTTAALGLEPGVSGEAYLVPHGRECTLIIGYQGMAKLFYQSPLAKHLDAQAVHANDEFDYAYGTEPYLTHKPALGDRGDVIAYYAVASLNTGASAFVVLSPAEVRELRGGKVGTSGGIKDPQRWMERKTVLRQLIKMLPKSSALNQAVNADEVNGSTLRRRQLDQAAQPEQTPDDEPAHDPETGEVVEGEVMGDQDPWAGERA